MDSFFSDVIREQIRLLFFLMLQDFLHSERRIVPQPGGIKAAEQGAKQGQDSFLQSSVLCVKFLEEQKYIWEKQWENFKSSMAQGEWSRRQTNAVSHGSSGQH